MIPRNVDGEMCLDVECGSNKAVLYVSKLFAGSKKECVLYENEWLTPNEFQNVSGRRSAKYWKRSIRHNGISLKTLMESGLLKAEDDSLSQADGEHFTIDNSGTGTLKVIDLYCLLDTFILLSLFTQALSLCLSLSLSLSLSVSLCLSLSVCLSVSVSLSLSLSLSYYS